MKIVIKNNTHKTVSLKEEVFAMMSTIADLAE